MAATIFKNPVKFDGMNAILLTLLLFLLINFNEALGKIFMLMAIVSAIYVHFVKGPNYVKVEKDTFRLEDIIIGALGYVAFILLSTVLIGFIGGPQAILSPLQSVFSALQSTVPALAESEILQFIGWGVIIPIIETTFFFGILLPYVAYQTKTALNLKSARSWLAFVVISFIFAMFHLTARHLGGLTFDTPALILTFLFAVVSCVLVVWRRELSAAIYTHIVSNSIATSLALGWGFMGAVLGVQ